MDAGQMQLTFTPQSERGRQLVRTWGAGVTDMYRSALKLEATCADSYRTENNE